MRVDPPPYAEHPPAPLNAPAAMAMAGWTHFKTGLAKKVPPAKSGARSGAHTRPGALEHLQCSIRIKSPGWRSVEPELSPRCRRKQRRAGISHRTYLPPVFQRPSGVLKPKTRRTKGFISWIKLRVP